MSWNYLGEFLEAVLAVKTCGNERGSHFSQTFVSERHWVLNNKGKRKSGR